MNLQHKIFAITGAARGLGLAMAKAFAAKGAHLAIIDLDPSAVALAEQQCGQYGTTVKGYVANVADEQAISELFTTIAADFGALHGLINNAGILRDGRLLKVEDGKVVNKMSLAQWQSVIDVNLTGVFLCGREAAATMVELGCEGVIINVSSVSREGNFGQSNYSAAKAGVAALTVVWAKELAQHNIRSMAIAPGFIVTEMVASMNQVALEKMAAKIPLKRLGAVEEIANTALYIAENDYLTGRVIEVDGGIRL